ncbi:MAG: hypothetical protein C0467_13300 [Planctomycetaceae bacterium]|nr:hypothetical protein [Planctomycetaceae bacterium]
MFARLVSAMILVAGCMSVVGCTRAAKLEVTRSYDVSPGEAQAIELDPQPKPQKITVDFKSADGDVLVLLFKEADAKGEDGLLSSDPKKALGQKKGKADSFTADVPENTATRIVVREAQKKTKVELKVTNKK